MMQGTLQWFHGHGLPAWLIRFSRLSADIRGQDRQCTVDRIRLAMLQVLDGPDEVVCEPMDQGAGRGIRHRIKLCGDANGLWYLRSELMQVVAASHGEREARFRLNALTALFEGVLPPGLHPHRTPLR